MIPDLTESELITLKKRMLFYGEIALKGIEEIQLYQFWWYNFKCTIQYIKDSEWFNKLIINIKPDPYYIENGGKNPTDGPIHFLALEYFFLDHIELESIFKDDPEFQSIMLMNSDLCNYIKENFRENTENEILVKDAAAREKEVIVDGMLFVAVCIELNLFNPNNDNNTIEQKAIFLKKIKANDPRFKKVKFRDVKIKTYEKYIKLFRNKENKYLSENDQLIKEIANLIKSD